MGGEKGISLRGSPEPACPQEYEHLAASLDGARMPLLEKMQAFSPASSKVDLVEAAEAHAWQLDQLALNLSRCGWAEVGCPRDSARSLEDHGWSGRDPGVGGHCPHRGQAEVWAQIGRKQQERHPWQVAGQEQSQEAGTGRQAGLATVGSRSPCTLTLPCLPHSIIHGVNQDRFIQRAIEAASAYSSILRAVQAAEGAAGQALQQASHTWAVRPDPALGPAASSQQAGMNHVLPAPVSAGGGAAGPGAESPGAAGQQHRPGGRHPWGAAEAGPW